MSKDNEKNYRNKDGMIIAGKYRYQGNKKDGKMKRKEREKLERKEFEEKSKLIFKQCNCNHVDADLGHTHLVDDPDGIHQTCLICGGKILKDDSGMLSDECIRAAVDTIYSTIAYIRNQVRITDKMDKMFTDSCLIALRIPEIMNGVRNGSYTPLKKKDKDKGKGKGKNKDDDNSFSRAKYYS